MDSGQRVKILKNRWKQHCFDRIQQPEIKDINRISWVVTLCTQPEHSPWVGMVAKDGDSRLRELSIRVAVISAKNHKRQRRKRPYPPNEIGCKRQRS